MCIIGIVFSCIMGFTIVDSVDIGDYANGVAFGDGYVWASENGYDSIFKIDSGNMQIISSFYYGSNVLTGLAHDGEDLWLGCSYTYIHKIDTAGNLINSWFLPTVNNSYGMTFDGQYIWHSDLTFKIIYKRDYNDPTNVIDSFSVTWQPYDLAWYGDHLWAIADGNNVYELDTTNMNIINSWSTGRDYSSGIAIGGEYLWFSTNYNRGWVYKVDGVTSIEEVPTPMAEPRFAILCAYPNPFQGTVTFSLSVPGTEEVNVRVFDPSGRLVSNLFSGVPNSSMFRVSWNGKDNSGVHVNSGIYFVRAETKNNVVFKKIISLGRK
jgi:hypothetical protein